MPTMLPWFINLSLWLTLSLSASLSHMDETRIQWAENTCCPRHTSKYACVRERGSSCMWLNDMATVVLAGGARCAGMSWIKCKTLDGNSDCGETRMSKLKAHFADYKPQCGEYPAFEEADLDDDDDDIEEESDVDAESATTTTTTTTPTTTSTSEPTSASPTTNAPTTNAPTTLSPTTMAPSTLNPTTANPTTLSPTTISPTTSNPTTVGPTTAIPTTIQPTTAEPTTSMPTTMMPTTVSPTTNSPTTSVPTTASPTTAQPTTNAPTTAEPTTMQPTVPIEPEIVTDSPTSASPTTPEPTTAQPTTALPTTSNPTTAEPTTARPTTSEPTTTEPTTASPTTLNPTTASPTTLSPTTSNPTTTSPTTMRPTTTSPTTANPTTPEPSTALPTTAQPTTSAPTTAMPTTISPSTAMPTTGSPTAAVEEEEEESEDIEDVDQNEGTENVQDDGENEGTDDEDVDNIENDDGNCCECGEQKYIKGCEENAWCEQKVCAEDNYCCTGQWDASCALIALDFNDDCSAIDDTIKITKSIDPVFIDEDYDEHLNDNDENEYIDQSKDEDMNQQNEEQNDVDVNNQNMDTNDDENENNDDEDNSNMDESQTEEEEDQNENNDELVEVRENCCECAQEQYVKGCAENTWCEQTVCASDNYCCTGAWDSGCVLIALDFNDECATNHDQTNEQNINNDEDEKEQTAEEKGDAEEQNVDEKDDEEEDDLDDVDDVAAQDGNCCECISESTDIGCAQNEWCEDTVCAEDNYCCSDGWDSSCVEIALKHYTSACEETTEDTDDVNDDDDSAVTTAKPTYPDGPIVEYPSTTADEDTAYPTMTQSPTVRPTYPDDPVDSSSSDQTIVPDPSSASAETEVNEVETIQFDEVIEDDDSWFVDSDATTTSEPTTVSPTTSYPTTSNPTTAEPTTALPTTSNPTTAGPTTAQPTTANPTTSNPTSASPTTAEPTTANPTTSEPTTPMPTTAQPTTPEPTTVSPTTSMPTTSAPTTANPTTSEPTKQITTTTISYPADNSDKVSAQIIPADVLNAEITCCKPHLDKASCFNEAGSNCVWFEDANHEIAVLGRSQCIGKRWAKCKMMDLNSACKTTGAKHGKDNSDLTALPKAECSQIETQAPLDQCRATLFANGADLLKISVSKDAGNTWKELSYHSDYTVTAHHLIENIDQNTIIIFEVDAIETNEGGFLADLHLKNLQNGEVDRIYTNKDSQSIILRKEGEYYNVIARPDWGINNKNHFHKEAQWIWDDTESDFLKFAIDFGQEENLQKLVNAGCVSQSLLNGETFFAKDDILALGHEVDREYEYQMFLFMGILMVLFVCVALKLLEYYYKDEHCVEDKFVKNRKYKPTGYGAVEGAGTGFV